MRPLPLERGPYRGVTPGRGKLEAGDLSYLQRVVPFGAPSDMRRAAGELHQRTTAAAFTVHHVMKIDGAEYAPGASIDGEVLRANATVAQLAMLERLGWIEPVPAPAAKPARSKGH